jgi:hypothetical protein
LEVYRVDIEIFLSFRNLLFMLHPVWGKTIPFQAKMPALITPAGGSGVYLLRIISREWRNSITIAREKIAPRDAPSFETLRKQHTPLVTNRG